MPRFDFDTAFKALTGHPPFPWQRRLFRLLASGRLPPAVDIPTGLGKTAVMALWLLARAGGVPLPRRLVYVVDRRAVVDQATTFAETIRQNLECAELAPIREGLGLDERLLPISTLRGHYRDNREWREYPAAPAIVVGTVDMVGSRLLFSGYGVSRRMRPYEAGLMGYDTLVMLDEAHLARPFHCLLQTIEEKRREFSGPAAGQELPPPFRVLPLSATLYDEKGAFRLTDGDRGDAVVRDRLRAKKALTVEDLENGEKPGDALAEGLAERAWRLAQEETEAMGRSPRITIYCDWRKVAEKVEASLQKRIKGKEPEAKAILFVGGRRVHEREETAKELEEYGLIADSAVGPPPAPVFLVATSAGEVGVDLDADHMVCDLVAWERMVQRLGRVNRRGAGAARVLVIDQGPPEEKTSGKNGIAQHKAVRKLLEALPPTETGSYNASPAAITRLREEVDTEEIEMASTPMPLYPALSRPLVDAWAMTSLAEHTGRPEVAPWLRGWVNDEPQTTVAWRHCLPLRFENSESHSRIPVSKKDVEAFFEAAPLQTGELLETETWRVVDWLKVRSRKLIKALDRGTRSRRSQGKSGGTDDTETTEGFDDLQPLDRDMPIAFLLSHGGKWEEKLGLKDIYDLQVKELNRKLAGRRLVIDARLGGIGEGLLDHGCDTPASTIEDNWGKSDAAEDELPPLRVRLLKADSSESHEEPWQKTLEMPYLVSPEGETVVNLVIERRQGTTGDEDSRALAAKCQTLDEHQQWASDEAARIAEALGLSDDDRALLVAAAHHHDDGKGVSRWQRAFNAPREGRPYAKTTRPPNQHVLNGYRHEFQSVLNAGRTGLAGVARAGPRFDLALHLIAAHHGHARPAIAIEGCDSLPPTAAACEAHEIAVRFARLQRQWGPWGLAWWEALLRAADQCASREHEQRASRCLKEEAARKPMGKEEPVGAESESVVQRNLFVTDMKGTH